MLTSLPFKNTGYLVINCINFLILSDPNFTYLALSNMNSVCESKMFQGHPIGGVGVLWRSNISNRIKIIEKDSDDRCHVQSCFFFMEHALLSLGKIL